MADEQSAAHSARATHLNRIKTLLRGVRSDIKIARDAEKFTALSSLRNQERMLLDRQHLIELETAQEADRAGKKSAKDMTPEQWEDYIRRDAQATDSNDLEFYVHEWLQRGRMRLVVEDGVPKIVRIGAA